MTVIYRNEDATPESEKSCERIAVPIFTPTFRSCVYSLNLSESLTRRARNDQPTRETEHRTLRSLFSLNLKRVLIAVKITGAPSPYYRTAAPRLVSLYVEIFKTFPMVENHRRRPFRATLQSLNLREPVGRIVYFLNNITCSPVSEECRQKSK